MARESGTQHRHGVSTLVNQCHSALLGPTPIRAAREVRRSQNMGPVCTLKGVRGPVRGPSPGPSAEWLGKVQQSGGGGTMQWVVSVDPAGPLTATLLWQAFFKNIPKRVS